VFVEEAGPTVELTGDTEPPLDEPATYDAAARATDADLETLTWRLGDRTVGRAGLSGSNDSAHGEFGFSDSGARRLVVVVRDSSNRTGRDSLVVEPRAGSASSWGGSGEEGRSAVVDGSVPEREEGSLTVAYVGVSRSEVDSAGCSEVSVVGNPTGSGTAAAVFCASGRGETMGQSYGEETCSIHLRDCQHADVDGLGSSKVNQAGDGSGDGYSDVDITSQSSDPGNSSGTTDGGRSGGDGYISVI
jgi:hypothetical protein